MKRCLRHLLVLFIFLSAAGCQTATTPAPSATPRPTLTSLPLPSPTPSPTATLQPTATALPTATVSPTPAPTLTLAPKGPPQGKWSLFSDPNDVHGLTVVNNQVWAATGGGVLAWDLKTNQPRLYTTYDGLAEIQGNDIVYCPVKGNLLYVSHENGLLSLFDLDTGVWSHRTIDLAGGPSTGPLHGMYCDRGEGRLYVIDKNSLDILDIRNDLWSSVGAQEGLDPGSIRAVRSSGNTVWLAAGAQGVYLMLGREVIHLNRAAGFSSGVISDLSLAPDGSAWFAYSTGIIYFTIQDRQWSTLISQSPSGPPFTTIDRVAVGTGNRLWIASSAEGVCPFDLKTTTCTTIYPNASGHQITSLFVDPSGIAYAGTEGGGILELMPESARQLVYPSEIPGAPVSALVEDSAHQLWMASTEGVSVRDMAQPEAQWQPFKTSLKGLASGKIRQIKPLGQGIWFFYEDRVQASYYQGNAWTQVTEADGLSAKVNDAEVDARGQTWLATQDGLEIWDGTQVKAAGEEFGLPKDELYVLFNDGQTLWVGFNSGLWSCREGAACVLRMPDIAIRAIIPDRQGGLLLGTGKGLLRYRDGQAFAWAINLGARMLLSPVITALALNSQGQIWAGSDGDGLLFFDGYQWYAFDTSNGLPANRIRSIVVGEDDSIWVAADTGDSGGALVRYTP